MISRRPNIRHNRGRIPIVGGAAAPAVTPLTILGASVLQWVRADLGITIGTGVSVWADQSGNGHDYAQATGAAQPAFNAAGGPNGTPSVLFDGVDDVMITATLNPPAPATTPTWIWIIGRQVTWTANENLMGPGGGGNVLLIQQVTATPQIRQFNASVANVNGGLAVNTYGRVEAYFSSTTSDYLKLISTVVTGTSAGNAAVATGRSLGATGAAQFANWEICELLYANALPSAGERAALDAYVTARYGAGLV